MHDTCFPSPSTVSFPYFRLIELPLTPTFFDFPKSSSIASRGDWLKNPSNNKVENNGAVVYVGSSLTVHNPLFSVHKF